jgi:hypothetical protein
MDQVRLRLHLALKSQELVAQFHAHEIGKILSAAFGDS